MLKKLSQNTNCEEIVLRTIDQTGEKVTSRGGNHGVILV